MIRPIKNMAAALSLLAACCGASAGDMDGLDLTLEVLGKDQVVDDRLVHRILIPGLVAQSSSETNGGTSATGTGSDAVQAFPQAPVHEAMGAVQGVLPGPLSPAVEGINNGVLGALGLGPNGTQ